MLWFKVAKDAALIYTGAQISCIRSDVIEYLYLANEPCKFCSYSASCTLADGTRCNVTDAVWLHLKLLKFEIKVLDSGPYPVIQGLDFLTLTQVVTDVSSEKFSIRFLPDCMGDFSSCGKAQIGHSFIQSLTNEVSQKSK